MKKIADITTIQFLTSFILGLIVIIIIFLEYYPKITESTNPNTANKTQEIKSPNAFFYPALYPGLSQVKLSLPYKYANSDTPFIELVLMMESGIPHQHLILSHPTLKSLQWDSLSDGFVTLYQKETTYKSIADFLKNPPKDQKKLVYSDEYLQKIAPYKQIVGTILPAASFDINTVTQKYILTTYKHQEQVNGFYVYQTVFDASKVKANEKNQMVWQLSSPSTSEELPITLGNIDIELSE